MPQHPDPHLQPEFYDSVPPKRLIAWFIDLAITAVIAGAASLLLLTIGVILIFPLLFIPVVWAVTGFLYRWATLSAWSATWGMQFMAIELRGVDGQRLDTTTALLHTVGTYLSFAMAPLQAASIGLMALTARGQGVTDIVLGTTMLNRRSR